LKVITRDKPIWSNNTHQQKRIGGKNETDGRGKKQCMENREKTPVIWWFGPNHNERISETTYSGSNIAANITHSNTFW
jgi:hypothetical protein